MRFTLLFLAMELLAIDSLLRERQISSVDQIPLETHIFNSIWTAQIVLEVISLKRYKVGWDRRV